MNFRAHLGLAFTIIIALQMGCEKKRAGFGLEDSAIRYQTKKFDDPAILAEVKGQKITREQILDKSPVIKDLEQQERDALAGLGYLKAVEKAGESPSGTVELNLPASEASLDKILTRFDRQPTPGVGISFKDGGEPNTLAKLKDVTVTYDDIDRNHVVFQGIEQRKYRETATQLNGQLSRILLNEEAMKQKMTLQDYIQKEVVKGKVEVSDSELGDYLKKIGFSESELNDDLRGKFKAGLGAQKEQRLIEEYVAKNILKDPILVSFTPPRTNLKLSEDWKPVMGYSDAPVSVVAFSSITCPDCPQFVNTLQGVMKKYDGHLKLNWIHNFSENDGMARMVAEAALCADAQKAGSSMAFIRDFTANGVQVDENAFYEWAKKNKLDDAGFKSCFVERKFQPLVDQHLAYAKKIGVVANPTLWVEGKTLEGIITPEQAQLVVEDKIEESGSTWFSALVRKIKSFF